MHGRQCLWLLLALALLTGCRTGRNYVDPLGPREAGGSRSSATDPHARGDTLLIVSFNIRYAVRVDSALAVLRDDPALRGIDVLLLQEMDAEATRWMAHALGMWYVYYPATRHLQTGRDFGNAVLSRWPIVADEKILLPHAARITGTRRTATAATLRIRGREVRVYSTHLGTVADLGPVARREQLAAVLRDAEGRPLVVLGGDLNDPEAGLVAWQHGYAWPTREGPRTGIVGRLDHIFLRGFVRAGAASSGTVLDVRGASDHRPVWVFAILPFEAEQAEGPPLAPSHAP